MIARGGEDVRLSEMNTEMVHQWDKLMQSPLFQRGTKRNALAGSLPEKPTSPALNGPRFLDYSGDYIQETEQQPLMILSNPFFNEYEGILRVEK